MCDLGRLQELLKHIEEEFKQQITGVIAVRVRPYDRLFIPPTLTLLERRHLGRQVRNGSLPRRVPEGVQRQRLWRVQHLPGRCQVRLFSSISHIPHSRDT